MWDQLKKQSKKGYFKALEKNTEAYVELCGKIKSAKAQLLAKLDESTGGEVGTSKKSKKAQEAAAVNDKVAPAQAEIEAELSSAQEAVAEAKVKANQAASDMFQLYANLLSVDAKFTWNEILHKQTMTDTYTDLQVY